MSLLPLGGVRVADHSVGIAGAYAAKLLSDSGATVVKIESPYRDPLRRRRALYEHLHEHHEQVVIDPTSALDRSRLDELLSSSGIVLGGSDSSGTRPRTDWNANLATLNPAAIAASISPFGASGPWCDGPANEFTLQAWSGKLATNYGGYADRPPVAAGGETGLWLTGAFVALGALAFFRLAARSGVGARVDVSILECMIAVFGQDAIARELADSRAGGTQRSGREIPSIHAASDGLVAFAIVTAQHWADFCVMIEQPAWGEDPELATSAGRRRRGEEVVAAVDAWVGERTTYEVTELAALLRIPAGVVADGATVPTLGCYEDTFSIGDGGFLRPRGALRFSPLHDRATSTASVDNRGDRPDPVTRPLNGLRIADFTAFWAGPYAAGLLALLGADVIHVESGKRPDGMRMRSARPPSDPTWLEWSSVFHLNNGSKRAVCIDMDRPEGLELAERLIQRSDGVIENFSPRVMDRFRLDRAGVAAIRADAVYVRMPAFGLDNPWRDRPAFQHTIEPLAGLAWITGYPDRDPQPVMICDALGGVHAAFAMLCGLHHRDRTGHGVHVEVRLAEVAAAIAAEQTVTASADGAVLGRIGNTHRFGGPQGVYECAPRSDQTPLVAISVDTDEQWVRLRALVDEPRWMADDALTTAAGRRSAAGELDRDIARWCATRNVDDVVAMLWRAQIPVGEVSSGDGLLGNQHLHQRGFYTPIAHPVCGELHYAGLPMSVSLADGTRVPTGHCSYAPLLAEHDIIIETLLGVDHDAAQRLRATGVSGPRKISRVPM